MHCLERRDDMRHKKGKIQLLFALGIVALNLGTFYYCDPLHENLSDLGNKLHHPIYMILWATSISLYLIYYTLTLMKRKNYTNHIGKIACVASCVGMVVAILLPYQPVVYPVLAKWHIRFAMASTIVYALTFLHFLLDVQKKDILFFQDAFPKYLLIALFDCSFFVLNGGVSTVLEVSFCIYMSLYLYYLLEISKTT